MTTLQDIKKDLPDWPDDVIDQWLLKFANQEGMGWPPPDPLAGRWKLLITHPLSWWKDVTWTQEKRDCGFDNLSIDGRKTMNNMHSSSARTMASAATTARPASLVSWAFC
ncbi:hypothetical protein JQ561_33720 [Bradyrhizobium diazoefficiens]|nr:hypothetical protein [Bradyrhizobium diazoefficiens]MBR0931595.1 hypothetical protein [Bradyrhizobium diazoefficiens]